MEACTNKPIIIRASVLFDGREKSENKVIIVEGSRIVEVTQSRATADYEGWVTPAYIDAHSHIGLIRAGEPPQEEEGNDPTSHIQPLLDPLNSVYFDDATFSDAVDFGVLYSCLVPGSGNLLGGQAKIIRNFVESRSNAVVKDYGYKMALGWNPRSTTAWKGARPSSRMGIYAMLEKRFDEILQKRSKARLAREKKERELQAKCKEKNLSQQEINRERELIDREYELEFCAEERALLELLDGKKTAKVHVHKHDDVLYLIELVRKYNLRATADHAEDVFSRDIFDALADEHIPVVYGPMGSFPYKVELRHSSYRNARLLCESRALFGLMSDHPVLSPLLLRDSLKFFLMFGMSDTDAISVLTRRNAMILGIDDQLGSIMPGMLASLVVWNRHPLDLGVMPRMVLAEGKVVRGAK